MSPALTEESAVIPLKQPVVDNELTKTARETELSEAHSMFAHFKATPASSDACATNGLGEAALRPARASADGKLLLSGDEGTAMFALRGV